MSLREIHFKRARRRIQFLRFDSSMTLLGVFVSLAMLVGGCTAGSLSGSIEAQPVLSNKQSTTRPENASETGVLALAGLKVHSGDVIDAITPIFAEVTPERVIANMHEGVSMGGTGGGEVLLLHEGYLITGINVEYGDYFGANEIVHIEIIWSKITPKGLDPNDTITSEKLGSGNFETVLHREELWAEPGTYISDIFSTTSTHTSGETFINNLAIETSPLSN